MDRVSRQVWFWVVALAGSLILLALLHSILLPFVVGFLVAYVLDPWVERVERLGIGRTAAAGLVVGLAALVFGTLLVVLAPVLVRQAMQLVSALPDALEQGRVAVEAFAQRHLGDRFAEVKVAVDAGIGDLKSHGASLAGVAAGTLWDSGMALMSLLSLLLITPLVVFYMLVDWQAIVARVRLWLPRDHAATIEQLAYDINSAVAAFVRGQGAVCVCLGLFYALALTAVGLNYGAVTGLATGLLAFVPMAGWVAGSTVALLIAALQFAPNWTPVAIVAAIMAAGMTIDTVLLSPRFVGQKVGLHPLWLIFALYAFSALFGLVGMLVAVPVSAAIAVLARFGIGRYLQSEVYRGTVYRGTAQVERTR